MNRSIIDNAYTHNFHPYAAKFPYYAVRSLIEEYTKPFDNVLDPFCGSGTTLVECRLLCRNATGIELNPVGKLISEAKSADYRKDDINLLMNARSQLQQHCLLVKGWIEPTPLSSILPNHPNKEFWFKPHVLKELYAIKTVIDGYSDNKKVHNLLMMAFLRIIVPVSNQESETRYKAIEKTIPLGATLRLYLKVLDNYIEILKDNVLPSCDIKITVIEGDSKEQIKQLGKGSFDFVATSPPYINSYDYYLYHKHRIYWLGKDPTAVRKLEMGNHHRVDRQTYENAATEYQDSMLKTFQGVNKVLKEKGHFALLIGDGIVKGQRIKADELVEGIAKLSGFEKTSLISIPLKEVSRRFIKGKNGQQKLHHVIVLRKSHELELN